MEGKVLKDRWVVVDGDGNVKPYSIATQQNTSITLYCMETGEAWLIAQRNGYTCIQVDITFTPTL